MMFRPRMAFVLAGLAFGVGLPNFAEDTSSSIFKFRGFLTLGATHASLKDGDFASTATQPRGAGYSHSIDFGGDTRLGLQADAQFTPWLSGMVQVVTERSYTNHFQPKLLMAAVKVQPLPWLSLKVGRMPSSSYLISDYKKVGYSMPWVRPPAEIYQANPLDSFDGGEVCIQHSIGSAAFNWQLQVGSSCAKVTEEPRSEFTAKDMYALSLGVAYGASTLRTYYLQFRGTLDDAVADSPYGPFALMRNPSLDPLGLGFNPFYAPALADQYELKGRRVTYLTLGYTYDPGTWFVSGEVARVRGDVCALTFNTGAYITGGMRMGDWTPYLTVARQSTDSPLTHDHPIIQEILAYGKQAQSSLSGGVRWDFRRNMDLKLQFDHVKNDAGSRGVVTNMQPGFQMGGSYNLITACFDMVF